MSYRLYSFVNHLYMNQKQWGIQTAHCVSTMSLYKQNTPQHGMFHDWALNEPTIIMCEGGNVAMLTDLYDRLKVLTDALGLPLVKFHEDDRSLGGVITSVAVLVPDYLFNCQIVEYDRATRTPVFKRPVPDGETNPEDPKYYLFSDIEQEFLSIVKTARLAN